MLFNRDDIDAGILLILDKLEEEDRLEVEEYIINFMEELDCVKDDLNAQESENCDLEEEIDSLKYDLQYRCDSCDFDCAIEQIVNDQMYVTKSYDTKEKILDKLEHTLRYGSNKNTWM